MLTFNENKWRQSAIVRPAEWMFAMTAILFMYFFVFFHFFYKGNGKTLDHKYTSGNSILNLLAEKGARLFVNDNVSGRGERTGGDGAHVQHLLFMRHSTYVPSVLSR